MKKPTFWRVKRAVSLLAISSMVGSLFTLMPNASQPAVAANVEIDYAASMGGGSVLETRSHMNFDPQNAFSVEAWIRPINSAVSQSHIIDLSSNSGFYLKLSNDNPGSQRRSLFVHDSNGGTHMACGTVEIDRWNHIALTHNGTAGVKCYVDGVFSGEITNGTAGFAPMIQIGKWNYANNNTDTVYHGQIDQVKIWAKELAANEVAASMHSWGTPSTDLAGNALSLGGMLRHHYDFNERGSYFVEDKVGSADLSLTGTVSYPTVATIATVAGNTNVSFPRSYLTATGGWQVPTAAASATALLVGGGGGGGAWVGGGGGGGGVIEQGVSLTPSSFVRVQVGQGGLGGARTNIMRGAANGQASSLGIATPVQALGGGAGASVGIAAGSGSTIATGGGGYETSGTFAGGVGAVSSGGSAQSNAQPHAVGGGGGAGGNGLSGTLSGSTYQSGDGGTGVATTINGSTQHFGGGGGGSAHGTWFGASNWNSSVIHFPGAGGLGGGAAGARVTSSQGPVIADSGAANTGGGGGGSGSYYQVGDYEESFGGAGGSGLIVISYGNSVQTVGSGNCEQTVGNAANVTVTSLGNDCIVTFTAGENTWKTPEGVAFIRLLIIGGGGAGGGGIGGGGGAGEYTYTDSLNIAQGTFPVEVGEGGTSRPWLSGRPGQNSSFSTLIAYGGGGGGTNAANGPTASQPGGGNNFGSAGGGGYENNGGTATFRNAPNMARSATSGGNGSLQGGVFAAGGGGGGGAGQGSAGIASSTLVVNGQTTQTNGFGGNGGGGLQNDVSGTNTTYVCGGGGGINGQEGYSNGSPGSGGCGPNNAGRGGLADTNANGVDDRASISFGVAGAPNTGSGGGGASNWVNGGNGGSGIVIVRYTLPNAPTPTFGTPTPTADGFTVQVTNYLTNSNNTNFQWAVSSTLGSAAIDANGLVTVSGVSGAATPTLTATVSKTGYRSSSATTSATSIPACSPTSTQSNGYTVLTFAAVQTCGWAPPAGVSTYDVLIVGGGGGGGAPGGNRGSGSGGAGGFFSASAVSIPSPVSIRVGDGGSAPAWNDASGWGGSGGDSSVGPLLVSGGGGGSSYLSDRSGRPSLGGDAYVSTGSGGGGTSTHFPATSAGGSAGAIAAAGIAFNGTTYIGIRGANGGSGRSAELGGLGGQITASSRTSSISASSVEYAKAGPGGVWSSLDISTRTYGSGGAADYPASFSERGGQQGVVVIRYGNTYTLSYDANGADSGSPSSATTTHTTSGSAATLATVGTMVKAGYNFAGWSLSSTGAIVAATYAPTSDVTLYAKWTSDLAITTPTSGLSGTHGSSYSLTISSSGGAGTKTFSLVSGTLPSGLSLGSASGEISGTPTQAGSQTITVRVTDSESNTATTSSFTITINAQALTNAAAPTVTATTGVLKSISVNWTAVTNASSYTLKIYAANGTTLLATLNGLSGISKTITASDYPSIADNTEYKISVTAIGSGNFSTSAESSQASVTTNQSFTVTYDELGGSTVADGTFVTGGTVTFPASPLKLGYRFEGWSETNGGTVVSTPYSPAVTQNITLFAVWQDSVCSPTESTFTGTGTNGGSANTFYKVFTFSSVDNCRWEVPAGISALEALLVAGGGGGGSAYDSGGAGGGGAGQIKRVTLDTSSVSEIIVHVGAGGSGGTNSPGIESHGASGANTNLWVSGSLLESALGGDGGSRSRADYISPARTVGTGGAAATSNAAAQGGAFGGASNSASFGAGGGGGGAGGPGGTATSQSGAVAGGLPLSINISGTNVQYGRGGAGSNWWNAPANGVNAAANTGNGGGGARASNSVSESRPGGSGGSGVVVFRVETTPANYTVAFNANLGTGTMASQTIPYNTATALTSNAFTRDGYRFMGWNTAADGTGTTYTNAQSLTLTSTSPAMTLFAQWQLNLSVVTPTSGLSGIFGSSYSLTLSSTGGAGTNVFSLVSGSLPPGMSLGSSSGEISGTSTQAGSYPITIRVTDSDGNIATTSSFTIVISSQVLANAAAPTVTATAATLKSITVSWTSVANASSYTLRIYASDGSTLLQTLAGLSGNSKTITAADYSGIADGTQYQISLTAVGTGNWATSNESAKSTVTTNSTRVASFDSNGGTAVASANFITGTSIAIPASPTKNGLYFGGWSTSESANQGDLTNRILSWPFTHAQDSSLTLYAIWLDDYSLNFAGSAAASARNVGTAQNPVLIVPTNQSFTWEAWIYPVADSSRQFFTILDNADDGNNFGRAALYLRDSGTGPFLQGGYFTTSGNGNWALTRTNTIAYDTWSHVAMTVTRTGAAQGSDSGVGGLEIRLYLNGTRMAVNSDVWSSGSGFVWSGTGSFSGFANSRGLIVGDNVDDPNQQFKGQIDQVKVWDGVLTDAEVVTSRTIFGKGSIAKNLRAHYSFNDLASNPALGQTTQNLTNSAGAYDLTLFAASGAAVTSNVTRSLNDFSISYDSNSATSGSVSSSTGLRPYQSLNLETKGSLVRTGYTFSSWNTNSAGTGSNQAEGASYQVLYSSQTLFARWTADTYTVTFNYNGADGGNTLTSSTYTTDGTALTLPTPTRTGYVFDGWFDDAGFSGTALGSTITTTSSKTIYAKWSPGTYTITYNYNDADGGNAQASGSFTTGGTSLTLPTPTKTGFVFGGWFDDAGFAGTALTSPLTTTASKTIHAKWVAGAYTILYEYNDADGANSTVSSIYTTGGAAITLPAPTRTGYNFAGWFENSSLSGSSVSSSYTTSQNRTLYAKWTAINYRIIYNADIVVSGNTISPTSGSVPTNSTNFNIGQTGSISANTGLLARTGYTFSGWVTNLDGTGTPKNSGDTVTFAAADINLYPQWSANTYTISYNLNGGSGSLSGAPTSWTVGTSNVTLPSAGFTKTGYDFAGWAKTQGGSAVNNSFNNIGDVTLYALWTIKTINYSFDKGTANGLTIADWPANSSSTFGSSITLPNLSGTVVTISSQSYLFFGWKQAGSTFESGDSFTLGEASPVFEAQWVQVFDVRYGYAGGTHPQAGDTDDECVTGGLCTNGQSITLRTAPTRTGYSFDGWKVQDSIITKAGGSSHVVTATAYLFYAQWSAIDYDFSYNSMGGSNNHASVTANIGQVITMPNPGSRTGYSFGGWSPDGGATLLSVGSSFVVGSESKSFVAYWVPNVYTVIFDWQGGTGSITPNASYTVGTGALSLPLVGDRVKDGYTFAGWATTPSGTVLQSFTPTSNSVLYAVWNDGAYTLSFDSQGGVGSGVGSVARGTSYTLPTPVRQGFVFLGWFDQISGGSKLGEAGQSFTPAQSRTLFGRWVQRSLFGVDEANLENATEFTASATNGIDTTVSHGASNSSARVEIPAGALPDGTRVKVRYFRDTTRQQSLISNTNTYVLSVLVSWLYGTGTTATVPDTNAGKSITLTLTNNLIKSGALVYMVVGNEVTELARATQDGTVTVNITEDPEIVVAIVAPGVPTNVVAVAGDAKATITWNAPTLDGGSPITSYVVTANTGQTCTWTTGPLSCEVTGLTNGTNYSFTVRAVSAVGASQNSQPATATPSAPSTPAGPGVGGSGPAAGIDPVEGQTRVWTKRISANQVKVYVKFPEMGSSYQIQLQKNSGAFRRVMGKTINTTADTSLRVVGDWYYLVRTIDLPGEGKYRIRVTEDGDQVLLNGKNRPVVYAYR